MGFKSSSNTEIYNNTILPQETRKISNELPNFIPKATRERRKPRVSRRKEIMKIRAEINELEPKQTNKQTNKNNKKDQ